MTCKISKPVDLSCEDKNTLGGVKQRVWVVSSLDDFSYTIGADGYITGISFTNTEGLVPFVGPRDSHSFGHTPVKADSGTTIIQHNSQIGLILSTPDEDTAARDLLSADLPQIFEDKNGKFYLVGATNGMTFTEGSQNSGTTGDGYQIATYTFQGEEKALPLRIFDTDRATTLALIEGAEKA